MISRCLRTVLPDLYCLCLSLLHVGFVFSCDTICPEGRCCFWGNAINLCQVGDPFLVKAHCLVLRDGNFINSFIQSPVTAVILPVVNGWQNSL